MEVDEGLNDSDAEYGFIIYWIRVSILVLVLEIAMNASVEELMSNSGYVVQA